LNIKELCNYYFLPEDFNHYICEHQMMFPEGGLFDEKLI